MSYTTDRRILTDRDELHLVNEVCRDFVTLCGEVYPATFPIEDRQTFELHELCGDCRIAAGETVRSEKKAPLVFTDLVGQVGADQAAHGWCDYCSELTEYRIKPGASNVGAKRLCAKHMQALIEDGLGALHRIAQQVETKPAFSLRVAPGILERLVLLVARGASTMNAEELAAVLVRMTGVAVKMAEKMYTTITTEVREEGCQ